MFPVVTSLDEVKLITVVALPFVEIEKNVLDEADVPGVKEVKLRSV